MIAFSRVDDRLIHGQVQTRWISNIRCNKIFIVDDKVAADPFIRNVLLLSIPNNIKLYIFTVDEAIEKISSAKDTSDRVLVLFKTPVSVLRLMKGGMEIKNLNIGPMSSKPNAKYIVKNVYLLDEEINALKELEKSGTNIYFQLVPEDRKIKLTDLKI